MSKTVLARKTTLLVVLIAAVAILISGCTSPSQSNSGTSPSSSSLGGGDITGKWFVASSMYPNVKTAVEFTSDGKITLGDDSNKAAIVYRGTYSFGNGGKTIRIIYDSFKDLGGDQNLDVLEHTNNKMVLQDGNGNTYTYERKK